MSEEGFDDMVEELVWGKVEELNEAIAIAIAIGNYKRANELLDLFFLGFTKKNKSLEDIMMA